MGYRLSKIYTRTGDDGDTNLGDGCRIPKNTLRVDALGTLDELNCALGLALSFENPASDVHIKLTRIQHELFDLGGELCPPHRPVITEEHVLRLEKMLDQWNETLPPLKEFLLPGGHPASSACHLARAICRRAERCIVGLNREAPVSAPVLCYINRLSDLLFVAARILAKSQQCDEILWDHIRS